MYTNAQENPSYAGDICCGILSVVSIITAFVCSFVFEMYWYIGIVGGFFGSAIKLFRIKRYKYLFIRDIDGQSLRIEFGVYSKDHSIVIPYTNIVSVRKLRESDFTCCCGCGSCNDDGCTCGYDTTIINANKGYGCCNSRNYEHLIDISLKQPWKQCGTKIFRVRVSTNDLDNLVDFLSKQNSDIKIIGFPNDKSVPLSVGSINNYSSM